jgi:pyruvate/2-oxoglutarate dehydrogenase complex dihydrolipoamide dehydrogenase (E3) component
VIGAEELYINPEKAGKRIVILGGGLVGSELAIYMGDLGRDVTILEMFPNLNDGGNLLQGQSIRIELDRLGVRLALGTKALEINEKGVIGAPACGTAGKSAEGTRLFEADTVVCAVGMKPLREEADRLRFCAPEFYQIGDCVTPKNIAEATRSAHFAALDLGRY